MSRMQRLKASLTQFPDIPAPRIWLLASEQRAVWEYFAGLTMFGSLKRLSPKGDGHPVLVIPGLAATDWTTGLLRRFLDHLGYTTYPWGMGRNKGFNDEMAAAVSEHLAKIYAKHKQPVSLIGQSLGGVIAREIARLRPDMVRQVITLGSPFTGHPLASTGTHLYEWMSGERMEDLDYNRHLEIRVKPPVPTTAVYSKLDGVVAWQCSIETTKPEGESIHLRGNTHCGMASSPSALYLIAERLAQPAGKWKEFKPKGFGRIFYGAKDHASATRH